ncbi:MAG: hypothetical protein Q4B09_05345 [Lachnospiraceae bacterium]|nr:hypothetical protein [Lachnospiraceae bacterium]
MKVFLLRSKESTEVEDCYGARLIEQGFAIRDRVAAAETEADEKTDVAASEPEKKVRKKKEN